jgi:hypothetical protein
MRYGAFGDPGAEAPGLQMKRSPLAYALFKTGFVSAPTPSTVMVTVSPACSPAMPDGVPVEITSPGSSVMMADT